MTTKQNQSMKLVSLNLDKGSILYLRQTEYGYKYKNKTNKTYGL